MFARIRIFTAQLMLPLLAALFVTLALPTAGLCTAGASAAAAGPRHTDSIEAALAARGLIGRAGSHAAGPRTIMPPPGTEVDESVQRDSQTGAELLRIKSWKEPLANNALYIEVTTAPTHQYEIAFWLMPLDKHGCKLFGGTMYSASGRALKSTFWRNDPALNLAGAAPFPADLYPDAVPGIAFFRALSNPRPGAEGVLNQQLTPYSYVTQDVSVSRVENVTVPAGTFKAYRVTAQARVKSLLPSWPGFVLHVVQPFVPRNTLYFEANAPHRLLKQEGTSSLGGPPVTLELVHYYKAGGQQDSLAAKAAVSNGASAAAEVAMDTAD